MKRFAPLLTLPALVFLAACSDDGGGSSGNAGTAGVGGNSNSGSLLNVCVSTCTQYYTACPPSTPVDCSARCIQIEADTPDACASLQVDWLACIESKTPVCGGNAWDYTYEAACDGTQLGACLLRDGAECMRAGSDYDFMCSTDGPATISYSCALGVIPAGCTDLSFGDEGYVCCTSELTL